jgi:hypothetical protein
MIFLANGTAFNFYAVADKECFHVMGALLLLGVM